MIYELTMNAAKLLPLTYYILFDIYCSVSRYNCCSYFSLFSEFTVLRGALTSWHLPSATYILPKYHKGKHIADFKMLLGFQLEFNLPKAKGYDLGWRDQDTIRIWTIIGKSYIE